MKYYAAKSAHGSESSHGFCNDTIVMAFSSRATRDDYVNTSTNLSTESITRDLVTSRASNWSANRNEMIAPKPFSNEYWGIVDRDPADDTAGLIGTIEVCGGLYANEHAEHFYNRRTT